MRRPLFSRFTATVLVAALVLSSAPRSYAYSVLTHEQIIDFVWDTHIKKILLASYPNSTEEELREAHAYAYGGCLIQDMGYYPFGTKLFSDLLHYVRSGDFAAQMIKDAQNRNELAFALGALSHYASDVNGHPSVNTAVGLEFPKLRDKYGDQVTYYDDPVAHIRVEFGFDVLQVAKQRYTSQGYHDFIGFSVASDLLDRSFRKIYGVELKDIFSGEKNEKQAIESYRRAVSKWIPQLTQVALRQKKDELEKLPNFSARQFRYLLSRTAYEREWGSQYQKLGFGAKLLSLLLKIIPKFGRLNLLDIKPPTPNTEKLYVESVEKTVHAYEQLLIRVENHDLDFPNLDLDTGHPTAPGEYDLADKTYARLLDTLSKEHFSYVPPAMRADILWFYGDLKRPVETQKHEGQWKRTIRELEALRKVPPPEATPTT